MTFINFPQKSIDLITIGRAGLDFYPVENNQSFKDVNSFTKHVGGTPANVAVGLARLGKNVAILTRISDDFIGEYIEAYLAREQVDTSLIQKDQQKQNSVAITQVKSPDECSVIMYREDPADLNLEFKTINLEVLKHTKAILITGTALSHEQSLNTIKQIIALKEMYNFKVFFDLDYRPYNWASTQEVSDIYSDIAMHSDVLIGNQEEYKALENKVKDDQTIANDWLKNDTQLVIIKNGPKGSTAFTKDQTIVQGVYESLPQKTYGAGDAFAAGLINQLLDDQSLANALQFGSASAALVVERRTCTEAMPFKAEIIQVMENRNVKI
jgi:5-dehydro-2-deoxygluconokinase